MSLLAPFRRQSAPEQPKAPTLSECVRLLAAQCDGASARDGRGFNREDAERGRRLAQKPVENWTAWDRLYAYELTRKYGGQLREAGLAIELIPQPPYPTTPKPVKRIYRRPDGYFGIYYKHLPQGEYQEVYFAASCIPGRQFVHEEDCCWIIPPDRVSLDGLREFARQVGWPMPRELSAEIKATIRRAELLLEGSRAVKPFTESSFDFGDLDRQLWPHQVAGTQYLELCNWTAIVADEMGTGKTALALRSARQAGVFESGGLLVICPATVKINWGREVAMWLPGKTARILKGGGLQPISGDVVIANYDILRDVKDSDDPLEANLTALLLARQWGGIVIDEAHHIKSDDAQRTLAVSKIIEAKQPSFRLLLTGTPILNRVEEFVTSLDMLDFLPHFGGASRFRQRYEVKGAPLPELNEKLRGLGYLCRLKDHHAFTPDGRFIHIDDVPLAVAPAELRKRHQDDKKDARTVEALRQVMSQHGYELVEGAMRLPKKLPPFPVLLEIERAEYDRAVAEFRQWLLEQYLTIGKDYQDWTRAMKAEALVRLTKLRELVGKLKAANAIRWTKDLLDGSEEKLVLFVEHDAPMAAFREAFPGAACITGGQSDRQRQAEIDRFQGDPKCRLIIAKIKAGGVGINLTAACQVAFLELGWNPGAMDQATDRVHRGGQTKTVSAYYLLAERTIDERLCALIDEKRKTVTAATHGGEAASDSIIGKLLEDIAA